VYSLCKVPKADEFFSKFLGDYGKLLNFQLFEKTEKPVINRPKFFQLSQA
jgi:hypothetical protein